MQNLIFSGFSFKWEVTLKEAGFTNPTTVDKDVTIKTLNIYDGNNCKKCFDKL